MFPEMQSEEIFRSSIGVTTLMTLDAFEFIRRFLLHILPAMLISCLPSSNFQHRRSISI